MGSLPRVLVLTMYCGEPQYQRCCISVADQDGVICDQNIIAYKPNIDAHRELYSKINQEGDNYDFYVKLDADMEFSSKESLSVILSFFKENTDHLTIPVFDYFTGKDMAALHVFSNKVRFDLTELDSLYVDKVNIEYPGSRLSILESKQLVKHCYQPSAKQCYAFGIHRAMKVAQNDRFLVDISASRVHYRTLLSVKLNHDRLESSNLVYVLKGASDVFSRTKPANMDNKSDFMNEDVIKDENVRNLSDYDRWFVGNELVSLIKILGLNRFILSAILKVNQRFMDLLSRTWSRMTKGG